MTIRLLWEPRDLWVGVYWTAEQEVAWKVYVCVLPCLPLLIRWQRRKKAGL